MITMIFYSHGRRIKSTLSRMLSTFYREDWKVANGTTRRLVRMISSPRVVVRALRFVFVICLSLIK